MSLPDFREKQVLCISAADAHENVLKFNNENICFVRDGSVVNQLSSHKVLAVFIIGDFSITTPLIRNCAQYGVSLFLLKKNCEVYAPLVSTASGNYLLRSKQYACTREFDIAAHLVSNKVMNQRLLIEPTRSKKKINTHHEQIKKSLESICTGKELLGFEGSRTKQYFSVYFHDIDWRHRQPRAKTDIPNVLLDLGYTLLFNYIDAITNLFGFDTYKGVYHTLYFQRKSLVCDLIEPFRCIIDRQLVKAYHLNRIDRKDFRKIKGTYALSYDAQSKYIQLFLQTIMEQKEEIFRFIRDYYYCIMNDTEEYPFFVIK